MKYFTGEDVQLLKKVEYMLGGEWFKATVVFISDSNQATDEFFWLVKDPPDWTKGSIAIKWDNYESVEPIFFVHGEGNNNANAEILFTDTEEEDELRFLSRHC